MKNEKEFNQVNEQELEQVAGGSRKLAQVNYRCPVCGYEETVTCSPAAGLMPKMCPACHSEGRGNVKMGLG